MNDIDELGRKLSVDLRRRAESTPVDEGSPWGAIHNRISHRHRARLVRRSLATVTAMAVVFAGLASLVNLGNRDVRQVDSAGDTPSHFASPNPNLPRLIVTLPGYEVTHAFDSTSAAPPAARPPLGPVAPPPLGEEAKASSVEPPSTAVQAEATGPLATEATARPVLPAERDVVTAGPVPPVEPGAVRLAVVGEPDRGYLGRMLFVHTMSASLSVGLTSAEQIESNARAVAIGDARGYLVDPDKPEIPTRFVRWNLANGQGVTIISFRMSEDELLTVARSMAVAPDQSVSWTEGTLPAGLSLLRSGEVGPGSARGTASNVTYEKEGNVLSLDVQGGDQLLLDEIMSGYVGSGVSIDQVDVSGVPATLVRFPGGAGGTLIWQVRPGFVAQITAGGFVTDLEASEAAGLPARPTGSDTAFADLVPASESLREIPEAEWDVLMGRFQTAGEGIDVRGLMMEMCDARGNWLMAYESAAADEEGKALNRLTKLFEIAASSSEAKNSDIASQLKRLVDTAGLRDAEAVRAIPEGGGCQTPAP